MDDNHTAIVDAAFDVAVFSKTHSWPAEGSPDFFEFAAKLDRLATAMNAAYPSFNRNIRRDAKLTKMIEEARQPCAHQWRQDAAFLSTCTLCGATHNHGHT